jgi:hypothetical protein
MKELTQEHKELIRQEVQDTFGDSIESFGIYEVVDASKLTWVEKKWAKENLDWKVIII